MRILSNTWNDLRHGLRLLAKFPAFSVAAVLSLAIGIGASTAIFSIANGLLLRPLPYAGADRIAIIWQRSPGLNVPQDWLSLGQYVDIATQTSSFEQTAAAIGASFNMTGNAAPERVDGVRVTSSFFTLFGARAAIGRVFTAEEDKPGKPSVILTRGFWQRRFGADQSVVGKTITLNGNTLSIIGVMSDDFTFDKEVMPAVNGIQRADVLLPLPLPASVQGKRDGEDYDVFAKVKPGVPLSRAQAQLDAVAARMKQQFPANYPANGGLTLSAVPLLDQVVGNMRLTLYVLLGAVGFLLLIACANVGNLLLSRAAVREKEMAVRAAVGASESRMLRQLLTESVTLSAVAGVVGLAIALGAILTIRIVGPAELPRLAEVRVDVRVLGFTLLVSLVAPILFGLVPSLRAARVDPNTVLKSGGRTSTGGRGFGLGHGGLRKILIAAEVALSVVLLVGAGLLVRSYQRVISASPGFNPRNTLSFRLSLPGARYRSPDAVSQFYDQLGKRVSALPGVSSVGTNYQLPLSTVALAWEPIGVEGYVPKSAGSDLIISSSAYVSPDYFRAIGIPLVSGRSFATTDNRQAPDVAIVNKKLAARFWPNESAIGKRVRQGASGPWRTIVGVVSDTKEYDAQSQPPITVYFPVEQFSIGSRFVVVRTTSAVDAGALMTSVTREVRSLDPDLPPYDVSTMDDRLHDSLARRRLAMLLLTTFALFALTLSAIGIHGVIAYWVDQRRQEIGIRLALGADSRRIVSLIAREFLSMVGAGLAIGLVAAFALARVMTGLVFGIATTDALTFAMIPVLLAAIAIVATYVPARRATRVEPVAALRYE